jgi:lysosomal Pro-X carboxypeptidase
MKYPASVVGAIAASAPILAFGAAWDSNSYWQVVSRDATPAAGAALGCDSAVRNAWTILFKLGQTVAGRATLTSAFKLCKPVQTPADVTNLAWMMLFAWDTMAMGVLFCYSPVPSPLRVSYFA